MKAEKEAECMPLDGENPPTENGSAPMEKEDSSPEEDAAAAEATIAWKRHISSWYAFCLFQNVTDQLFVVFAVFKGA